MSQLQQLKNQIDAIGTAAKKTGGSLESFSQKFNQHVQQVQATIGGSSQGKDQAVIQSFTAANAAVKQAVAALQQAATTASNYGQSL